MFYAAFTAADGQEVSALYDSIVEYNRDTWSPATDERSLIAFRVRGRTYRERQEDLVNTAQHFQRECEPGLSMLELSLILDWFYKNGKRYGLLREFQDNCIC